MNEFPNKPGTSFQQLQEQQQQQQQQQILFIIVFLGER
jgi:hypothetical protein